LTNVVKLVPHCP